MKYNKKLGIRLIFTAMLLFCMISSASAFEDNGVKWEYGFAAFTVDSSIPSSWSSSITLASSTWNNAGADFYFYQIGGQDSQLIYTPLGSSGVIALNRRWNGSDYVTKCVMKFNSDKSWSTTGESGKFDVQNIATHEFGHWLSLGDTTNSETTMYQYAVTGETKKRTLHSDDIAGIKAIYGV